MADQPSFPRTAVQITPEGLLISIILASGLSIHHAIGEETMNEICKQWIESRRQVKHQLQLMQDIQRTKNN